MNPKLTYDLIKIYQLSLDQYHVHEHIMRKHSESLRCTQYYKDKTLKEGSEVHEDYTF